MTDYPSDLHARVAVNATAARVMQPGTAFVSDRNPASACSHVPLPTRRRMVWRDLSGVICGRLTVIGLASDVQGRWVCRCVCGHYVHRAAKALKSLTAFLACDCCQHTQHLKRTSTFNETGEYPADVEGGTR